MITTYTNQILNGMWRNWDEGQKQAELFWVENFQQQKKLWESYFNWLDTYMKEIQHVSEKFFRNNAPIVENIEDGKMKEALQSFQQQIDEIFHKLVSISNTPQNTFKQWKEQNIHQWEYYSKLLFQQQKENHKEMKALINEFTKDLQQIMTALEKIQFGHFLLK